jgi:hypothetical protein
MKRMQEKIKTQRQVINPEKGCNTSNVWEQPRQIKIVFLKNLRAG